MSMLYLRNKPIGAISDALDDKVSKSGDTMSGNLIVDRKDGTASAEGNSTFTLGNSTPVGSNQNSTGLIHLYSESAYPAVLYASPLTATRYIGFPNKNGTLALTSDCLPTIESFSATTNSVGAFIVSADSTKICVGLIFTLGSEYTYYQYDERNFILFNMSGTKMANTAITGRAILIPK